MESKLIAQHELAIMTQLLASKNLTKHFLNNICHHHYSISPIQNVLLTEMLFRKTEYSKEKL